MTGRTIRGGLAVLGATLAVAAWAPPALAGGGCHVGPTQGRGDRVEMVKACFTPNILRTDPGTEVTFVNRDPYVHNLSGNRWGYFDDLHQGDAYTATFDEPGVYPFACTYHPGMTGAIVVGDGTGPGSGAPVQTSLVETAAEQPNRSAPTRPDGGSDLGWLMGGAAGMVAGAGLTLLVRRRRPDEA
jgi:plastocyanin